jgi:ubiquinone/menaquinone biosynthesis C-methylase UbiE
VPVAQAFRCPACGAAVDLEPERAVCAGCAASYPISNGIFDFRQHRRDYYFNPVPRGEMASLIREAGSVPWDATVRRFLKSVKNPGQWVDNLVVNGRYSWKLLLELPPKARVLDLGCGLGNLTSNLAPHVAEVVALDLTWERLLFAQERFKRFNPGDGITVVAGGDGKRLPFPDAHFDCVVLSGVLEWVADDGAGVPKDASRLLRVWKMFASFFGDSNPRRIQLRFLRELRRILKPDGQLMVAIENRLDYEYFTGRPDHHSGLLWASLMPRMLANVYSITAARRPYRTYTHSYFGVRRLFAAAGFPALELYGLAPGYSGLAEIIPADTPRSFWAPSPPPSWKDKLKRSRYFVPAYGIVGSKNRAARASMLDRMLAKIAESLAVEPSEITLSWLRVSEKDKTILSLKCAGRGAIAKIPFAENTLAGEEHQWHVLKRLPSIPGVAALAPAPLAHGSFQDLTYYVESAVAGRPLRTHITESTRARWAASIGDLLVALNPDLDRAAPRPLDTEAFDRLIATPIERLRQADPDDPRCDAVLQYFRERLEGVPMRLGFTHGDLTRNNVFIEDGALSGVIDWEYASERGLSALDAIAYVESNQRLLAPGSRIGDNFASLAMWKWSSSAEVDLLNRSYQACAISPALHSVFCSLAWLHHLAHQLDTTKRFSPEFVRKMVRPFLVRFAD